jgi:predicted permease
MPDFKRHVRQNLPPLGVSGAREAEIVEELALQLEEAYDRALANGLTSEEAWFEAGKRVASWQDLGAELQTVLHERVEPEEGPASSNAFVRFGEGLWRDLRQAARQLAHSPAFTAIAILTLALGIGANTAIFSLLDAVLLRNLPVQHPEQLVWFGEALATGSTDFRPNGNTQLFSNPFFREFQRKNAVFTNVAAIDSRLFAAHGRVAGGRELERLNIELVSGSYFRTMGVNAAAGRLLSDSDDDTPGAHPVAVASYAWWRRHFAGDRSFAGKTVTVGSTVYTIAGVAWPGFFGATVGHSPDLWIPLAMQAQISPDENGLRENMFQSLHIIARTKPGVGAAQARANTNLLFRQIIRTYLDPQPTEKQLANVQHAFIQLAPAAAGRSELRRQFSSPLRILMVIVALVLLIACANVANLLLARATARRREIAVRMSMGAGRPRLVRQLLVESGLLGLSGAVVGVALAWGGSRLLLAMVSTGNALLPISVSPDLTVVGFTAGIAIVTVLLFGAAPAFRATGFDLAPVLKEGRSATSAPSRSRLARGLVVAQVALSLVLLAGAGLFLRSLSNLAKIDTGFDRKNVLLATVDASGAGYKPGAALESMMLRVEERVRAIPGVQAVSFSLDVFDGGGWSGDDVEVPGRVRPDANLRVDFNTVGPDYLDVLRLKPLVGRGLTARDTNSSPRVAVVNETFAKTFYPGVSPLGHVFSHGDDPDLQNVEVVGVVKDAKYMGLEEQQMGAVFYPYTQHQHLMPRILAVRYSGKPGPLFPEIRQAVSAVDPNLGMSDATTLEDAVDNSELNRRLIAQLATFFGGLAAFLACIGIYGVMSYAIARRTSEFGLRMALGAARSQVLWAVLRDTLVMASFGIVIGAGLTLGLGGLVRSMLFGLEPEDPLVLALAAVAMIGVALAAGFLPAQRATRIDPSTALRHD